MYDVIIVGAGIAGCTLGKKLIDNGLDVLIIEKTRSLKKDSGIVAARNIGSEIPKKLIKHAVKSMEFVSPSGSTMEMKTRKPFAFILDRQDLNNFYRKRVKSIVVYDSVKKISWDDGFVKIECEDRTFLSRMVVGCDGAYSTVGKFMNIHEKTESSNEVVFGVLAFDKIKSPGIRVYFNKHFSPDFFAWTIEQTNEYGLMCSQRPIEYLEYFRKRFGFEIKDMHAYPMKIGIINTVTDRCLLVGEAAAQSKPITGGGIDLAIVASNYAASTISDAFKNQSFNKASLSSYETSWKRDCGKEIKRQLFLRNIYRQLNNKQIDELFNIGKKHIGEVSGVDDYIQLSELMKNISKTDLFLWGLRNFGAVFRSL